MINKALDLPFDEPQETYSTSMHLFHDLGIPEGTKGRIVPPAPAPEKRDQDRRDRAPRERAPRNRTRQRTRTRGGAQVAASGDQPPVVPAGKAGDTSDRPAGQSRNRNRRRRRRSGSGGAGAATTETAAS
jgi:hypothetical protein